ncbi:MAG: MoaD/ThiS family protein [Oscillospiraceae bacterium]|nr:MoaD/ThiS family protein [Oscillospiraceae bacterium]
MDVIFYGSVQEQTLGEESFDATGEARSLRILVDVMGERFGSQFKEFLLGEDTCFFLVNGSGIMTTGGLDTPLHPDDKVEVLPFVPGG